MGSNKNVNPQSLLLHGASYSGWLKKQGDGLFSNRFSKKYGVVANSDFYLFDDDNSSSASNVLALSEYCVIECSRDNNRWGFNLESKFESKAKKFYFAVGSERELLEWVNMLSRKKKNSQASRGTPDGAAIAPKGPAEFRPNYKIVSNADTSWDPEWVGPKRKSSFLDNTQTSQQSPVPPAPPPRPIPQSANRVNSLRKISDDKKPYEVLDEVQEGDGIYTTMMALESDVYLDPNQGRDEVPSDYDILPPTVYQWGLNRDASSSLLTQIGTPGLYLIRKGRDERNVISAFLHGEAKHYIIFHENGKMFLRRDQPPFQQISDLVRYYRDNNLPTCPARLEVPYK